MLLSLTASFPRRYRLAGLPGEYQGRNITSPEVNYCLLRDLIIWTQYEIQVAAYNSAGLGVFSRAVTEYTLQGGKPAPACARPRRAARPVSHSGTQWSMVDIKREVGPLGSLEGNRTSFLSSPTSAKPSRLRLGSSTLPSALLSGQEVSSHILWPGSAPQASAARGLCEWNP